MYCHLGENNGLAVIGRFFCHRENDGLAVVGRFFVIIGRMMVLLSLRDFFVIIGRLIVLLSLGEVMVLTSLGVHVIIGRMMVLLSSGDVFVNIGDEYCSYIMEPVTDRDSCSY